jgi:diacylglycerol kinase family enzyme
LKVSLVVNPIAGNRAHKSIKKIEALLKEKVSLQTFITRKKGEATAFARELSDTDLLIVAGGDGTFNEVINGVLSSKSSISARIPLAFLPVGTTNVLAKELGIPESIEKSIHLALTGTPRKISVGRVFITRHSSPVTRYFCLMAGIGFDGETVLGVKDNIVKKISGKGAHILSGIKTLIRYNPPLLKIKTSKGELTGYTAVIGKASCYGGYFKVTP